MRQLTLKNIAKVCSGTYYGPADKENIEVTSITTDSREANEGSLFVAIKGAKVDGNRFVMQTYSKGAICCISEVAPEKMADKVPVDSAYIVVASCLQALKDIAEFYRAACDTKIIGITGSVGKTSTKEMIASVLSQRFNTLKTQGNFNNEVGVPLTLFRLREQHEVAIVEMGISDFGEMTRLSKVVKPDACVITNIGQCHLENLGDRDGVLKAKTEIFKYMNVNAKIYLNGDDDKLVTVKDVHGKAPVLFGFDMNNDVYAENIKSRGLAGTEFDAVTSEGSIHIHVPVPGRHMVSNALAAVAVARDLGMTREDIIKGVEAFMPVDGHSSIFETDRYTVMDDCYNANPVSMKAGIDVLSEVPGRKVAILGDMFELGIDERNMHYEVGEYVADHGVDILLCIGSLGREYYEGASSKGMTEGLFYFEDKDKAISKLSDIISDGDSILVKASHAMEFEKVVAVLKDM